MEGFENDSRRIKGIKKGDSEGLFERAFKNNLKQPSNTPLFESKIEAQEKGEKQIEESRSENFNAVKADRAGKSSLRMKYEAEVEVIRKTHGDLEDIRRQLGLSKRKMSQLLLVDPSAWTRWTGKDGEAPPHIYRALQWYLTIQKKHPELNSAYFLNSIARPQLNQHDVNSLKESLRAALEPELRHENNLVFKKQLLVLLGLQALVLLLLFIVL